MSSNRVLIIDGRNLFMRSLYLCQQIVENVKEHPSQHLLTTLMFNIHQIVPSQVIFVFDGKYSNFRRRQLYPQYKVKPPSQKQKQKDSRSNITQQVQEFNKKIIFDYIKLMPIKFINTVDYQADDAISYITNNHYKDSEIILMSTDKDFYQLLSDNVKIYDIIKKYYIDKQFFKRVYTFPVQMFIYYKILLGDRSDNVQGINGIGDATIRKLFFYLYNKNKCNWWSDMDQFIGLINQNRYQSKICRKIFNPDNLAKLWLNHTLMNLNENVFMRQGDRAYIDKLVNQKPDFNFIKLLRLQSKYNFLQRFKNKHLTFKTIQFGV